MEEEQNGVEGVLQSGMRSRTRMKTMRMWKRKGVRCCTRERKKRWKGNKRERKGGKVRRWKEKSYNKNEEY